MTAVLNYVILILIGLSALAAVFFVVKGIMSRSQASREAYGVGQQDARRSMQIDIVRGAAFVFVGLILWGVYGLSARPAETTLEPTTPPPTTVPTARAATSTQTPPSLLPTETPPVLEPTQKPTQPPPTATPSPEPEPTQEPTEPASRTAVVISEVGVWLRGAPSSQGEQLEWVLNDTTLTVLPGRETADDYEWQQVRSPGGNEGWVAADFIEINE
ncbi:MAG: SH3 domain-containing protein [Chloroflexi bacterium]|nr:SH3 domain-containing protein [Chloroflexota bacterium]